MKCYVPCVNCSYEQVAQLLCDEIVKEPSKADVCLDDVAMFAKKFPLSKPRCVLWGDTMHHPGYLLKHRDTLSFVSASKWVYEYYTRYGFHVLDYRPYPVAYIPTDAEKDVDFIVVGVSRFFDRKNLSLVTELGIRSRTVIVGEPNPPIGIRHGVVTRVPVTTPDYHAFTLPDSDLHALYARARFYLALSVSEGIGLPPIEASLHGVIPVYVNGHGYRDNLVGLPVDVRDEYTVEVDGYYFRVWEPFLHDVKYEIEHALTMSRDEYEDLKARVIDHARARFGARARKTFLPG